MTISKETELEFRQLLEENKAFIAEGKALIAKMRKILNVMLVVAGIVFIPFFYSFVDVHVRVSKLESSMKDNVLSKDEIYRVFVQKVDALAVHMMEDDWKRTQLYEITSNPKYKTDLSTQQLIKAFFSEEHRGVE